MVIKMKDIIIAGMATIPERLHSMLRVVDSISEQVDHLYIYFNRKGDINLDIIDLYKNVSVVSGEDIGANGKFYFLDNSDLKWDYYFSIDDDFHYPSTYVDTMVKKIEKYNKEAAVCCHGSIIPANPYWYLERINVFSAKDEVSEDKLVNLAGTGTLAFHRRTFPKLDFSVFKGEIKCDLVFSIFALMQKIPIISIKRNMNWLRPIMNDGPDYWSKMLIDDDGRTELSKKVDWSFKPSKYFTEKPEYWEEGSKTQLITRYRFLLKQILGGIPDKKYFMLYPITGLKQAVDALEKVYFILKKGLQ